MGSSFNICCSHLSHGRYWLNGQWWFFFSLRIISPLNSKISTKFSWNSRNTSLELSFCLFGLQIPLGKVLLRSQRFGRTCLSATTFTWSSEVLWCWYSFVWESSSHSSFCLFLLLFWCYPFLDRCLHLPLPWMKAFFRAILTPHPSLTLSTQSLTLNNKHTSSTGRLPNYLQEARLNTILRTKSMRSIARPFWS